MTDPLDPARLHEALSGRVPAAQVEADVAAAVRFAASVGSLPLPDPPPEAGVALRRRFDAFVQLQKKPAARDRLLGWFGAGPVARPLFQRLAAGALAVVVVGSGASAAAGENPLEIARGTGDFLVHAVRSLDPSPGSSSDGDTALPTGTPSPEATPDRPPTGAAGGAALTRTPDATSSPGGTASPSAPDGTPQGTAAADAPPGTPGTVVATPGGQASPSAAPSTPALATPTRTTTPAASTPAASPSASPTTSPSPSPSATVSTAATPPAGLTTEVYSAGSAGSVTVGYGPGVVQIESVAANSGWTYSVEPEHAGWAVDFRNGDQRVRLVVLPGNPTPTTTLEDKSSGGGGSN